MGRAAGFHGEFPQSGSPPPLRFVDVPHAQPVVGEDWLSRVRKGAARKLEAGNSELGDDHRPRPQYFQLLKRKKTGRAERQKEAQIRAEAASEQEVDAEMLAELED